MNSVKPRNFIFRIASQLGVAIPYTNNTTKSRKIRIAIYFLFNSKLLTLLLYFVILFEVSKLNKMTTY